MIRAVDAHPYAHHPARLTDIRAILARLADISVNTISEILLTLGEPADLDPDSEADAPSDDRDAWIKRRGHELLPGLFFGRTLGTYDPQTATIRLNSTVYDPAHFAVPRWQILLRLRMFETLVHEVGHHRWACDSYVRKRQPSSEEYAVDFAARFVPKIVVPYLDQNYRAEVDCLLTWLERQVGVRLSLAALFPDRSDGAVRAFSELTPGCAVEHLARAVVDGDDRRTRRFNFARDIHYGARYDEALQIVDLLLADDPTDFQALDLQACILRDQGRFREARSFAHWLTIRFPINYEPWSRLSGVCRGLKDWAGVLEATAVLLTLPDVPGHEVDTALLARAKAHIELGNLDAAVLDLDRLPPQLYPGTLKQMERLRAEIEAKKATEDVASPAMLS